MPLLGPNIYAGARHLRRLFQLTLPGVKPVAIEDSDQAELPMTILARTASNGIRGSLDADSAQLGETAPFKGMQSKAVTEVRRGQWKESQAWAACCICDLLPTHPAIPSHDNSSLMCEGALGSGSCCLSQPLTCEL